MTTILKFPLLEIKEKCLNLPVGQSCRFDECPFCFAKEKSFSVTRIDEGILYNCFRAKCGKRGFISSTTGTLQNNTIKKEPENIFNEETRKLTVEESNFLQGRFGLTPQEIEYQQILFCPRLKRVVFTLFDKSGLAIGYLARWYEALNQGEKAIVKSYTYWNSKYSIHLHFPKLMNREQLKNKKLFCLVEDVVSAIKLNRKIQTIALLGTSIPSDSIRALIGLDIMFCLDKDATTQAIKLQNKFGLIFNSSRVVDLHKDPKDMKEDELNNLSQIINTMFVCDDD